MIIAVAFLLLGQKRVHTRTRLPNKNGLSVLGEMDFTNICKLETQTCGNYDTSGSAIVKPWASVRSVIVRPVVVIVCTQPRSIAVRLVFVRRWLMIVPLRTFVYSDPIRLPGYILM